MNLPVKGKALVRMVFALVIALSLTALVACSSQDSGGSSSDNSAQAPEMIQVEVVVDCSAAVNEGNEIALNMTETGELFSGVVDIDEGGTALDALKATGLDIGETKAATGSYVSAINTLAEKEVGPTSGWVYEINGEMVMEGIDAYVMQAGDKLTLTYVTTFE